MKSHTYSIFSAVAVLCLLTGCAELEQPPGAASTGTQPELELFGAEVRMTRGEKLLFTIHAPHISRFEPQQLILMREEAWSASVWYDGPLLAVGLAGYVAAAIIFTCRDIPVPR